MTFLGSLQELLRQFMDYRRAAGYATATYECMLMPYIRFCGKNYPDADRLTQEMLDAWLRHYSYSTNTQAAFIACARQFARFARFIGKDAYVPDDDYTIRRIPYEPYIFQDDELEDFFDSVDRYTPATSGKRLRHDMVLPPLFRMMYCCGMRPGEPLMLLRKDVDTESGDVYIRETKRHKDRHIIMSGDMRDMCKIYDRNAGDRKWFFEYSGKPFSTKWMTSQFHRRWKEAGITGHGTPRPYDLRHAFASRNIMRWVEQDLDIMAMLPFLSTYMGHSEITSTLYYVHLLPEKLRRSAKIDWGQFSVIYGKDGGSNEG